MISRMTEGGFLYSYVCLGMETVLSHFCNDRQGAKSHSCSCLHCILNIASLTVPNINQSLLVLTECILMRLLESNGELAIVMAHSRVAHVLALSDTLHGRSMRPGYIRADCKEAT